MSKRKLLALSLVVASSMLSVDVLAQPQDRPVRGDGVQGPRGEMRDKRHAPPRQSPGHVIRRADTNDDGLVSLAEFLAERSEQAVRQFEHRDTDGDGLLSGTDTGPRHRALNPAIDIAEFRACIAENGGNPDLEEDPFSATDANADGAISKDEFYAHHETRASEQFARIDANADGQLSAEELRSNIQAGKEHREIVRGCLADARDPLL